MIHGVPSKLLVARPEWRKKKKKKQTMRRIGSGEGDVIT